MKKELIGIFICMLLIGSVLLVTGNALVDKSPLLIVNGNILYVDDNGPNDPGPYNPDISDPLEDGSINHPFDEIQEGIDASGNGDTVYVYRGYSYREQLYINKSIELIGHEHQTHINSSPGECGIYINKDNVKVSGFQVSNSKDGFTTGITINEYNANNVIIKNNSIINTNIAIYIDGGDNNHIYWNSAYRVNIGIDIRNHANNNTIERNWIGNDVNIGIKISNSCKYNIIKGNNVFRSDVGIKLSDSDENKIISNRVSDSGVGIKLYGSDKNEIIENEITENFGIYIISIVNSYQNNFYSNIFRDDNFLNWVYSADSDSIWEYNYWGRGRILPKIILVRKYINNYLWSPDIEIDWNPRRVAPI